MPILGIFASSRLTAPATAYESIATTTVGSGGSANVEFTSIPATYTHLQIRGIASSLTSNYVLLNFNSDTGANYRTHFLYGDGANAQSTTNNDNYIFAGRVGNGTNVFSGNVIDILDYTNTNKNTTVRCLIGNDENGSGVILLNSGLWTSTNAITSITLTAQSAGSFRQYSQFALYGIKGA
jgi:hypothetical protein